MSLDNDPGEIFYSELFTLAPELRQLFVHDMREQSRKFTSMITFLAFKLDRLEEVMQDAADLGKRHKAYKVPEVSYDSVYQALINTLHKVLGDEWNAETESDWHEIYLQLSQAMQSVEA